MIEYILNPISVEALGWTLLHSIWQGAVFAILLVLIFIALRSYTAQSRYVVSVGLLGIFFLTVSTTFWQQFQEASNRVEASALQMNKPSNNDHFLFNNNRQHLLSSVNEIKNSTPVYKDKIESNQSNWQISFRAYYDRHLPLLVTFWFMGVLFLQLRFLGQLAYVQRLKHYGTQLFPTAWNDKIEALEGKLRIQKKVGYLTSIRIESPMVIGWLKPVVLLPQALFNSLSETEIYAILAHELAHIRREDFIVNLMQTFLCNVFFFHPGVWWMSARIDDEREHCCDDLAVAATGQAMSYAKTLINVSELQLRMQGKGNSALAMAFSGKNKKRERGGFSGRIRRLFLVSNGAGTFREGFMTACILITGLFLGVVATGRSVQTTDLANQSKIDTVANTAKRETSIRLENKNKPTTTITTTTLDDHPIPTIYQVSDEDDLPVATCAKPAKPEPPVSLDNTRIDALISACMEGDLSFVKTLINSGIDINGIGTEGFTPLMMATSNDEADIVEYLLNNGADFNQSYNGWTALIEAADEGSLSSMKLLLKAGAHVNYFWKQATPTAISMAASEGNLECLQLLLEYGADINGIGNSVSPLHIAAAEGKGSIIDFLISQKANLNKKDGTGRTALMYAASEGQKDVVLKLIEAGADHSIKNANGIIAKDYAETEEEYDTRDYLETGKRPDIHQATLDGLIEKVQRMVEQGSDINSRDDYGRTPLHIASAENHNIDMRVLIDLGADINAQDQQGRTPLMYAAADGKGDAVALLVSETANVYLEDVDGMRAYEWAQSGGNAELANFLGLITKNKNGQKAKEKSLQDSIQKRIQKEVEKAVEKAIKKEMKQNETLHVSANSVHLRQFDLEEKNLTLLEVARNGTIEDCANLLNNGMPVNASDDTGQTALMVAARNNRLDIAKFLIEQGADVNRSSVSGLTALHYTALENHDQMALLLLENNASVDATMRYSSTDGNYDKEPLVWEYIGATPLLIAIESQNLDVLAVLIKAGANKNHSLTRNGYKLNKDRDSYLTASEVMGIDEDFLEDLEVKVSDDTWTPYKQALLLNESVILALLQNKK